MKSLYVAVMAIVLTLIVFVTCSMAEWHQCNVIGVQSLVNHTAIQCDVPAIDPNDPNREIIYFTAPLVPGYEQYYVDANHLLSLGTLSLLMGNSISLRWGPADQKPASFGCMFHDCTGVDFIRLNK